MLMSGGDIDELDLLLEQYESQAAAEARQVEQKTGPRKKDLSKMSMRELREEGLAKPVAQQSKGFQMLAKMGYQAGEGIGKDTKGISTPLDLVIKPGKTGLGVDEDKKRRKEQSIQNQEEREAKRAKGQGVMQDVFKSSQASRHAEKRYDGQLKQAREVCETLDRRRGIFENPFWPKPPRPEGAEEEEIPEKPEDEWESLPSRDRLINVLTYLRCQYKYCLHCGCQYDSSEDLAANCPGLMEEEH